MPRPCISRGLRLISVLLISAWLSTPFSSAQSNIQPSNAESAQQHYDAGWKLAQKGSFEKALQESEAALGIDQNFAPALLLKSEVLVTLFKKKYNTGAGLANLDPSFLLLKQSADSLERYSQLTASTSDSKELRAQLASVRAYANLTEQDEAKRTVFRPKETTVKARILNRPSPTYSPGNGTVILLAVFEANRKVNHIMVLRSLSDDVTKSCVEAARNITFEPALKDGRAVSMVIQIEYHFNSSQ